MPRKYTQAQKESARKWDSNNLDRLSIALPKGSRDRIKAAAHRAGQSTNAYIRQAVDERMERDGEGESYA